MNIYFFKLIVFLLVGRTRTKDKYRVVYTDLQRLELEKEFHFNRYITITRKTELSKMLSLSERQVSLIFNKSILLNTYNNLIIDHIMLTSTKTIIKCKTNCNIRFDKLNRRSENHALKINMIFFLFKILIK